MPGRNLGDAYIVISPDTRLFGSMTDAQVRKAIAGINPNVRVGADTKGAAAAIASFKARVKALSDNLSQLRLDVKDDRAAAAKIAAFQAKVLALAKSMAAMTMRADTKKIDAQIAAKLAQVKDLRLQLSSLQADANTKAAAAKIASLEAEAFHLQEALSKGKLKADVDITKAETRLEAIDAELRVLSSNARAVKLSADNKSLLASIAVARADLAGLQAQARDIRLGANVDPAKLLAAESTLLGLESAMAKLVPAAAAGDVALGVLGKALTGTGTGWGFLTRGITLFGGAFNRVLPVVAASVAVWHVLADVIIELGAVWIPATLAVGAFAIAASDAAVEIQRRMQAVHTVMDATGQAVPPLTNKLEQLHKAVRPQVYQLFGDALTIMNSRAGTFQQVAKATGTVLDQLGARIVFAVTANNKLGNSTNQLSGFWKTAITDVSKLGDSIGNVFGIFGNLFRALPGFAAGLLTIGDDFTKILETASAAAVPVLKWILLLHGYILYTGLAVTATLAFIGGMANLAKQFFTFAAGSVLAGVGALKSFGLMLAGVGRALLVYITNIAIAGSVSGGFAAALAPLAANPMLWVTAAAIALGALVFEIVRSKNAAQQFNDTMQQTISNASLSSVVSVIQNAQAATTLKLAQSTQQLNQAIKTNTVVNAGRAGALNSNGAAIQNLGNATRDYQAGLGKLDSQQQLVSSRFGALTKKYGSGTAALGLLNAAGITGAQITSTQGHAWAEALIQIDSTVQAYRAMGTQAGTLGNDLDVLGRTLTDQYKAVQALNQGWSAFISDVTGTQGTFDTAAQGFLTLQDHTGRLTFTLGKLKASYADNATAIAAQGRVASATAAVATAQNRLNTLQKSGSGNVLQLSAAQNRLTAAQDRLTVAQLGLAAAQNQGKSAIDALTPAGIALNQAFGDQVQNIDKLFASWRTAGLAGNLFTQGVAAAIAPLEKYAAGSQEATAQLVALGQEAGYQGPISLQALNKYLGISTQMLGDTHGATQKLKDITNQATTQEALLTGAMQAQGSFIASKLLGDINNAILAYSGVEKAVTAYGTAVAQSGKDSDIARTKMKAAIAAIVTAELSMGDNASQMAAIVAKTFGISMPAAMQKVQAAMGDLADKALPHARDQFTTFAEIGLRKTTGQAHDLWNEIATRLGPKLDALGDLAGGKSKAKFIDWARNGLHLSKDEATNLWRELVKLQDHIDGLHGKTVKVNFVGSGSGSIAFKESIPGVTVGPSSAGLLGFHAAGGMISGGTPGKDSVLGMLMPGEVVVPTEMVRQGAVDHLRGQLPGFASGGYITGKFAGLGDSTGILTAGSPFMAKAEAHFGRAVEAAFAKAVIAKFKKDMNSLSGSGSAIVSYARSFLGKIPYVFGGNSLSGGIDCSGFTQQVYGKFGIHAPRTSEAQFAWVTRSGPVPGGLAFYDSPAGGPPPGHVAIVQGGNSVISQGGGMGPQIQALNFLPLMGTGVPKGGFPSSAGGGGNQAIGGGSLQAIAMALLKQYGWANQWPSFNALENSEAGWRMNARNPSSGAYGLAQFINGPSEYFQYGGNPNTGLGQLTAMMNYIAQRYGSPNAAWAFHLRNNYYGSGGKIPGMAAGGKIPLGKYLPQLRKAQGGEYGDYIGLRRAYLADVAHARKGSWTSGHKAGIRSELGTLAKVQSLEEAAYDNILHHGTARANLARFATRLKAVTRTSRDKDLSHSHPGLSHGLQYWLGVLTRLSQADVAPVYGGSQVKLQFPAWLAKAKTAQAREVYDYRGLEGAFHTGLSSARKGTWLYQNRRALGERLYAVAVKQNAEAAAFSDLIKHSSGSVSDLAGLTGRIGKLGSQAGAEAGALQPALLGHLPGGHPGWVKALQAQLKALTSLTAPGSQPFNPPWAPGNLGPSHTVPGGVLRFDTGRGVLQPGMNLAWNGTGRPEALSRTGGGGGAAEIHLHVHNHGVIGSQQQTDTWLQNSLNRLARTGYLTQAASRATGR